MSDLPRSGRVYVVALTVSMVALMAALLWTAWPPEPVDLAGAAIVAALMTLAWLYPLRLAFKRRLYLDTSVLIAAIVLLPTGLVMLAACVGTLTAQRIQRQDRVQSIFNGAQMMAQAAAGGLLVAAFDDRIPHRPEAVGYVLLAGIGIFVVNVIAVGTMVAIQSGASPVAIWRQSVTDDSGMGLFGHLSQVVLGAFAVFLAQVVPWALPLLLLPTLVMYLAFRGWVRLRQRAEMERYRAASGPPPAARVAQLGTWEWNLATGDSVWSAETRRLLDDGTGASYAALLRAIHPLDREAVNRAVHVALRTGRPFHVEHRIVLPDGTERFVEQAGQKTVDAAGGTRLAATIQDVTERKTLEARLAGQALHDPVTGLPNRAFAMDQLAKLMASRTPVPVAVLVIEINGGDGDEAMLVEAARRLRPILRDGELLARFAMSRFIVVLEVDGAEVAMQRAVAMREALGGPQGPDCRGEALDVAIGAAVSGVEASMPRELVRAAEDDLRRARSEVLAGRSAERSDWSRALVSGTHLRDALDRDELSLFYQPEVALATGDIVGFEAVIRWRHPTGVWLLPGDFMPVAEASGMTGAIGRWALAEAARAASRWPSGIGHRDPLTVSVDVAGAHFHEPGFVADVADVLDGAGLAGRALRLELSEATAVDDADVSQQTLEALRELGVRVTIDDFGAGYAFLGALQRLPVDMLKLDRSLVAALEVGEADRAIVQATASLARTFGMRTGAKGIETPAQLAWAEALGCVQGQGFFFSAALDERRLTALLERAARAGDLSPATLLLGATGTRVPSQGATNVP